MATSFLDNLLRSRCGATELEIKACEHRVSRILVEHDGGASDISSFLDAPESNVLFTTADQLVVIDWAELEAKNIELRDLLGENLSLLSCVDS